MAESKAANIRQLSDDDLSREINEAYRALFTLRFQHASRQLQNYQELGAARRRIARLRTIKREREIETAEVQE
ncbi:MAG: 50S ribosomal protein L29 [Dehalococcoidia bacterium]|nr:50S ribosomal protein L29 [Dehalococcoidia bacterium]MCB9485150.1 50S ribosomal protein L29 [Thermoflexaceae bacterium]